MNANDLENKSYDELLLLKEEIISDYNRLQIQKMENQQNFLKYVDELKKLKNEFMSLRNRFLCIAIAAGILTVTSILGAVLLRFAK